MFILNQSKQASVSSVCSGMKQTFSFTSETSLNIYSQWQLKVCKVFLDIKLISQAPSMMYFNKTPFPKDTIPLMTEHCV